MDRPTIELSGKMTVAEYNQCVEEHADGVFRFILKNIKQEADAQDIVQNAFEILWKKHDEIASEKAKSYVFTVAHNNMIDQLRKNKRMDYKAEMPEDRKTVGNSYTGLQEVLQVALDRLPDVQKQAVLLRDYEGYKYEEIGEILNLSESQVKVYIFRARKALQQYLTSIEHVL